MKSVRSQHKLWLLAACLLAWAGGFAGADVRREIQERYRSNYANKALFLKIPIFSEKQFVYISGQSFRNDQPVTRVPRYKVGDQLRVLAIDFSGEEIKFKLGAIAGTAMTELIFKFDSPLQENFPNSGVFDNALAATFTEGLKYTEIDDAKRAYVEQEFDRSSREIATIAGTTRETVLKYVAPKLPSYQEALQDVESLQNRNQDLGKQIAQAQAENRKLEAESKSQQAELARLRTQAASLQEKIDSSSSQLLKLGEDLRSARGVSQNYQRELVNLQRSLKIRVDPNRDLVSQIAELGQAMQKLQKDNEDLQGENLSLRSNLEKEQAENARLSGENQDLTTAVRQKDETIRTLTSKEDSLARQYFVLKQAKDNLENIALAISNLTTRVAEEKANGGIRSGKISVHLGNVLLGTFEWQFPGNLTPNQEGAGEVYFARESIDYVRVTPAERHILQSLGDRWKVRVQLSCRSDSLEVRPVKDSALQEISERDRAAWRWRILSRDSHDSRLFLKVHLLNRNGDEIPLLQSEQPVQSSTLVREVRGYLQPIPLLVGVVLGSVFMGIAGLFRRSRHAGRRRGETAASHPPFGGRKQL